MGYFVALLYMDLLNKLLSLYNLSNEDYILMSRPIDEISLKDPLKINGMDKVKTRIEKAILNKEKIIVYGDYDCDGITATSIMVKTFKMLGYPISYYIPSRYIDGYGLNEINVLKIAKNGFNLIICVDNGISANEAIKKANEYGIDVIVIDHHEIPENPVDAYGVIHPIVSDISPIVGSGGYMSLFVSAALLGKYDDYLVTLAGLSTVSDLMELKDYNRDVVRLALDKLSRNHYLPLIKLIDSSNITEKTFGLEIAPKINAVGRIVEDEKINRLVRYLTSDNQDEINALSEWIISINDERKTIMKDTIDCLPSIEDDYGICIETNMKEGLVGLISNRLLGQYNKPSIVFTNDSNNPDILKGSIRSKKGFNVVKSFKSLEKYIVSGGGHALAGGLSIKKSDLESFKKDFNLLCQQYPIEKEIDKSIEITVNDVSKVTYDLVRSFAPFGMGFEEPEFVIKNLRTRSLKFNASGTTLSTPLTLRSKLLGFNMLQSEIKSYDFINIYGSLYLSEYRGIQSVDFRINKYENCK